METNFNGHPDREDLDGQQEKQQVSENVPEINAAAESEDAESKRKRTHEDHHINRKYRLFSNHSSYGDSPHTNTSF